jgi:hypothetical protein
LAGLVEGSKASRVVSKINGREDGDAKSIQKNILKKLKKIEITFR